MKKAFYTFAFTFFGLLLATIMHAVVELLALQIIFGNPEKFSETVWWTEWEVIHDSVSYALWIIGAVVGGYFGMKWWGPYGSKSGLFHFKKKL